MKFISKYLLTGLATVLPVFLTGYLLYWMLLSAEAILGGWIKQVLPAAYYWPGMGVITALLGLMFVGLLMHAYLVQRLFGLGEALLYRVPIIKSVYRAINDFFTYFSPKAQGDSNQVVSVTLGPKLQMLGFITRNETSQLPAELQGEDNVLVYLPLSYMIGGHTVAVPRSALTYMDMSMEQAMRFAMTAGVTGDADAQQAARDNDR